MAKKYVKEEKKAIDYIVSLPKEITQDKMQEELLKLYLDYGIESVMEALFRWELKTGYITKKKMTSNLKLNFYDKEYKINFRLQVNIARSQYNPQAVQDKNLPKLHCPICFENIGRPGKEYLRAFVFPIDGKNRTFFIQATPFPLFWTHFVLINMKKVRQKINFTTLEDLFNFTDITPNYTNCSNSDLEWTGASILKHLHYQIFGNLNLPVMDANILDEYKIYKNYVEIVPLHYPCGVVRLRSSYRNNIMDIMNRIISYWKTSNIEKQSVNLIVRKSGIAKNIYEAYIFLRNSDFRTPKELQKIKSEGIGIIEMAGEAIIPVPSGDKEEIKWKWEQIKKNGLNVIKGIIMGNNPIKKISFWNKFLKESINFK